MAIHKWKRLSRAVLLDHPRIKIVEDEVVLPDGKMVKYIRHAPARRHSVIILAVNDHDELLVQREYSYPPDQVMWQLPGGAMEEGEDIIVAAKRELQEESGLIAEDYQLIGYYYVDNRRTDCRQFVVLCRSFTSVAMQNDPEEFIESSWLPLADVKGKISNGEITNITLLAALNVWFCSEL